MSIKTHDRDNFAVGSVAGNILRIAGPMTMALIVNILYSLVDRMYLGRLPEIGHLALTGIGLAFPLMMVISAFQAFVSSGGPPLFAIANGSGDREEAKLIQGNALTILLMMAAVLTTIAYIIKEPLIMATGGDQTTFPYADSYLSIYLLGTLPNLITMGMNPFITAQGHSKTAMLTIILGAVINILLDPIFIFVLDLGVAGAAIATVIAQYSSAIWVLTFLRGKRTPLRLERRDMRPQGTLIRRMIALGITGFVAQATSAAVSMIYNRLLFNLGGSLWIGAMTIVSSIRELAHMPVQGITGGAQPVIGYNYGAGEYQRVRQGIRIMTWTTFLYNLLAWAFLMWKPDFFIRLFNSDPDLMDTAVQAIRTYYMAFPFFSFQMTGQASFVGLGQTRYAIVFSLLRKVILVMPMAFLIPRLFNTGAVGVIISEPISEIIGGLACYITMYLTVYRKLGRQQDPRMSYRA